MRNPSKEFQVIMMNKSVTKIMKNVIRASNGYNFFDNTS
jgi:hypothetical protein